MIIMNLKLHIPLTDVSTCSIVNGFVVNVQSTWGKGHDDSGFMSCVLEQQSYTL
jgi:hypothetical protein